MSSARHGRRRFSTGGGAQILIGATSGPALAVARAVRTPRMRVPSRS